MADTKISDLTEYTTPTSGDWLPIVDVFNSTTKKINYLRAGPFPASSKVISVGPNGTYEDMQDAINQISLSDLIVARTSQTHVITATNGSATVTGVGTSWKTGTFDVQRFRNDDLWKPDAGTQYYKIKRVVSDTEILLYETFKDTTITATSTAYSSYELVRHTIIQSGFTDSPVTNAAAITINKPGIDIFSVGGSFGGDTSVIGVSDNIIHGFNIVTGNYGSTDKFGSVWANAWAGSVCEFVDCRATIANYGGQHAGGNPGMPVIRGGIVRWINPRFRVGQYLGHVINGSATDASVADTIVEYINPNIRPALNIDGLAVNGPWGFGTTAPATYSFINADIRIPDLGRSDSFFQGVIGIVCGGTGGANGVVNINGGVIRVEETTVNSYGIYCFSTSQTVNIMNCDIEANHSAINCNRAGTTVNVRHSRLKGGTYDLNLNAGTLNYDNMTTLIGGANNGSPTLLDT